MKKYLISFVILFILTGSLQADKILKNSFLTGECFQPYNSKIIKFIESKI